MTEHKCTLVPGTQCTQPAPRRAQAKAVAESAGGSTEAEGCGQASWRRWHSCNGTELAAALAEEGQTRVRPQAAQGRSYRGECVLHTSDIKAQREARIHLVSSHLPPLGWAL